MVVTKVFQIKNNNKLKQGLNYIDDKNKTTEFVFKNLGEETNLENKIDYIVDKEKVREGEGEERTDEYSVDYFTDSSGNKEMVSCYGLTSPLYAYEEMMMTKEHAKSVLGKDRSSGKVDVLAHHFIQSFSPEDKLTPEEVHEIGRRTVLELTRGEHEFIIATHLDKEHLHNHIIFNTTNNITLKKFRWQKGTKKSLENISDKHADFFGAKIIDREKIIDHKKYSAYKKQNTFRYELREKLKFLMKNSHSIKDFLEKAKILNIEIDGTGKELKFKIKGSKQERYIRDGTLSKKGYYSKENIAKMVKRNKESIPKEKIKQLYEEYEKEKSDEFEMRFIIEDWQVLDETKRGIYIEVEFGINNRGIILIPYNKIEKLEDGYEVFIKRNDYFYFLNEKNSAENKYIKGTTLAKQLSSENKEAVIYKNYYISRIDELIKEFNYLSNNNVTEYGTFRELQEKFKENLEKVETELDRLDIKVAELNKLYSALSAKENGTLKQIKIANEILKELKIPHTADLEEVEKLLSEVRVERELLRTKYNEIIKQYKYAKQIKKNTEVRKNNYKINTENKKKL